MASAAVQALRRLTAMTLSQDPTRMVKERGPAAQDGVGAIVEWLKGWDDAAQTDPDKGAERRSPGSSSGSWAQGLCLGKERAGTCKVSGSPL